jgi:hypothetical protein
MRRKEGRKEETKRRETCKNLTCTREGPKVSGLIYKSRTKQKILRGIYSAIYGEVNVSVSGGYVLQYAGCTRAISVTLKISSGRKLLDANSYLIKSNPCPRIEKPATSAF